MGLAPAERRIKGDLIGILRRVPSGRVMTFDAIAVILKIPPRVIATLLAGLTETEREIVPWHRAVAKGGAIGRGSHRDQQFARLVREGVLVSPAGILQDISRVAISNLDAPPFGVTRLPPAADHDKPPNRSRGMKDRPG
jgi:methylated-DNA-protein-cysteine methyltransferase related protein